MRFSSTKAAATLAAVASLAQAQTSTSCDPTKQSCPSDPGLNVATFNTDFTQGASANASWSAAAYSTINYGSQGAEFTINAAEQAPTISSDFYIFFGRVEVKMKAAPGTGIVSSIVLESDDLDEIDWEFLGGDTTQTETNFFGKGNTTLYNRAIYYSVDSPQTEFHTYTVDWTAERLEFIIDGVTVRTLAYDDPLTNGGSNYPQTPMRVKLGNWAGGGPGEPQGTVEWAGGSTDFSQGPFTMYVASVSITNYNPATSYVFGDMSGSWQSIQVVNGGSTGSASSGPTGTSSVGSSGSSSTSSASGSTASAAVPTMSLSVAPVNNSGVVATSTVSGATYSTNLASVSAQNSGIVTQPTVGGPTSTRPSSSSSPTTNAAVRFNSVATTGSLLGAVLGLFWML